MRAVTFEAFLQRKYPTEKRFGLDGCESFIPSMIQCMETCAEKGRVAFSTFKVCLQTSIAKSFLHRGGDCGDRHGASWPLERLDQRLLETAVPTVDSVLLGHYGGLRLRRREIPFGDARREIIREVKFRRHRGGTVYRAIHLTPSWIRRSKKKIMVALMANPSHLEAINPVVVGRVRAEQVEKNDIPRLCLIS